MSDDNILNVKVITPKETLYRGEATSVSSINSEGKFDILAHHANFITMVEKHPIEVRERNQQVKTFNFSQAIIYNTGNEVSIYAEPLLD